MVSLKFLTEVYELLGEQGYAISFSPAKQKSIKTDTRNSISQQFRKSLFFKLFAYTTLYSLLSFRRSAFSAMVSWSIHS